MSESHVNASVLVRPFIIVREGTLSAKINPVFWGFSMRTSSVRGRLGWFESMQSLFTKSLQNSVRSGFYLGRFRWHNITTVK